MTRALLLASLTAASVSLAQQPVWPAGARAINHIIDTGANSGDVTVAAPAAATANGLSISGQALSSTPADATHPGHVTTGAQTFAGDKTLNGSESNYGMTATAVSTPVNSAFSTSGTGGTLVHSTTYYYRVTATTALGETLASAETSITTPANGNADTLTVTVNWGAVTGATGYKVYGRSTGAEQLISSSAATSFVDTGAASPSGAMPGSNTTGMVSAPNLVTTSSGTQTISGNKTLSGSTNLNGGLAADLLPTVSDGISLGSSSFTLHNLWLTSGRSILFDSSAHVFMNGDGTNAVLTTLGNFTLTGSFLPGVTNTYNLGSSSLTWHNLWLAATRSICFDSSCNVNLSGDGTSKATLGGSLASSTQTLLASISFAATSTIPASLTPEGGAYLTQNFTVTGFSGYLGTIGSVCSGNVTFTVADGTNTCTGTIAATSSTGVYHATSLSGTCAFTTALPNLTIDITGGTCTTQPILLDLNVFGKSQ